MMIDLIANRPEGISSEVWCYFLSDYLRPQRPALAHCYARAEMVAFERNESLPSISTLKRHLAKIQPAGAVETARGDCSYLLIIDERDTSIEIMAPPAPVEFSATSRGFSRGEFIDLYGKPCSVQDSSLATADAIWLGVHENRMHLSREHAAALLPLLQRFIDTGSIGEPA
ncbi:DNA-binding domain-containing protein [Sphingopyxis sp. GW247-27LB]|uniref:DNA-binding domain-containing protein n=1 Tax=Sphingopyxis sp. GW247-27LB TaxID=2012632 RepID=UPI000BA6F5DA|nr:DNA-binding domain-containing protein [Sphingopyxis sp. GW247-27LB]PAL25509.1 hypothetical protein CD928_03275 [Sphingopyxis sp. GW247-27LB]